ncbi:cell wall protein [Myxococcus xanthus]|nr:MULTISPECIES: cell wall protein [Myxococcus]UYI25818.1 cell wall protein [Myxococcus xanthus]
MQPFHHPKQGLSGGALPAQLLESEFRAAIREEVAGPVAALAAALSRLARRFSEKPQPVRAVRTASPAQPTEASQPVRVKPTPAAAPMARACAVIGCKRPHRSQGYCAAHYQKRRLMVATGRLHAAWVEDAAPHSIPDVILPRGRRPKADAAPPAPTPPVSATPRMWVRKKGAAGADGTSGQGAPTPAGQPPLASERERATATAQRWASEFRSRTRRA